ncbi:phenylalanyl-tRNA ligase subunit beta [Mycoplasmoides genitalium M2288]|uniref:phenylalanine--tRNA ligase subunit beta n=1 Tax=Mycoplasmoides genitalium TaxID=2097 RepID=UPI00027B3798|nr:phenylalanine--tRNA ligase subunit beta [Mycoplasmoides genitalium]AFQ04516.1 phenylalanyl-tRNA ligase subunit beta [Mycoplasmoides genitalium M2288]
MLISKKTLGVLIPDIFSFSNDQIAQKLEQMGIEVESIKQFNSPDYLQLAKVVSIQPHPHDNKLFICELQIDKNKFINVVSNANNINNPDNINKFVIVAKKGTELLNGLIVKTQNIKGIISEGILCSYIDINPFSRQIIEKTEVADAIIIDHVSNDHDWNQYLSFLSLDDVIFDVKTPTNRADLHSLIFLAKELGVLLKTKTFLKQKSSVVNHDFFKFPLNLKNKLKANYFGGLFLRQINQHSSPWTVKGLLINQMIKPVNYYVDKANLVTVFTAQPIHCHDADRIVGNIELKQATHNETFVGLDDKQYEIEPGDIVVCDEKGIIALVGIIGSKRTMVQPTTTNIFFEVVNCNSETIKQTAKRFLINNFASKFMVKQISLLATDNCLNYLQNSLLTTDNIGKISHFSSSLKVEPFSKKLTVNFHKIRQLIGIEKKELTDQTIKKSLSQLGFKVDNQLLKIPSYRQDINTWQDISEEIVKLIDINKLKPIGITSSFNFEKSSYFNTFNALTKLRKKLQTLGFHNVITYQLTDQKSAKTFNLFNLENFITIKNPVSQNHSVMRVSLIDSLLKVLQTNNNYKNELVNIFEFSFIKTQNNSELHLAVLWVEKLFTSSFNPMQRISNDVFTMKGLAKLIVANLGFSCDFEPLDDSDYFVNNQSLKIVVFNEQIGFIGLIKESLLNNYDLNNKPIYCLEINLDRMLSSLNRIEKNYLGYSKLQPVCKDLTFSFTNPASHFDQFANMIKRITGIESWKLISVFETMQNNQLITKYTVRYFLKNDANKPLTNQTIELITNNLKLQCEKLKIKLDI